MAYLSDILSQAQQGAKNQVKGVQNQIVGGLTGAISNAKNNIVTGSTQIVGSVLNNATRGVIGAASDLMQGNVSAAGDSLAGIGEGILDTFESVTGLSFGSDAGMDGISFQSGPNNGIFPGNSYAGINARPDPVFAWDWYTEVPVIQPNQGSPVSLPWYYIEEANLPSRQYEQRSIFREGRDRHYPTKYTVEPLRLAIYADNVNNAIRYIEAWKGLVVNPTTVANAATNSGFYGPASKYKRSIKTFLLAPNKAQLIQYEYTECWPMGIESVNLISGNSERVVWHVTFSVGDVFSTIFDVSNALNTGFMGGENPFPSTIQDTVGMVYSKITGGVNNAIRGGVQSVFNSIF